MGLKAREGKLPLQTTIKSRLGLFHLKWLASPRAFLLQRESNFTSKKWQARFKYSLQFPLFSSAVFFPRNFFFFFLLLIEEKNCD